MADQQKTIDQAEALIRRVLGQGFNQDLDADTLRAVAEKVARAVPVRRAA